MKKLSALSALFALALLQPAPVSGQQPAPPAYKPELIEFMVFTQIGTPSSGLPAMPETGSWLNTRSTS